MDINLFDLLLPTYMQIIIPVIVIITMWLPFYRKFNLPARILFLIFIVIPAALSTGCGGILILISITIRTFTFFIKTGNDQAIFNYTCEKCGFIKELAQTLKLYKCPQCGHKNLIE